VAECPVNAIYAEEDVPANQQQFIKLNVELARKWPSITKSKAPLSEAEQWKDIDDKLQYLER
jgi:ferredoxin